MHHWQPETHPGWKGLRIFLWMKDLNEKKNSNHPPPAAPTLLLLTWFHQPLQPQWQLWSERSSVLRWDHQCSARRSLSSSPARAETDTLFTCKPKQRLAQSHERFICQLRHQFLVWVFFCLTKTPKWTIKGKFTQIWNIPNISQYIYSSLCWTELALFGRANKTTPLVYETVLETVLLLLIAFSTPLSSSVVSLLSSWLPRFPLSWHYECRMEWERIVTRWWKFHDSLHKHSDE